MEKNFDLQKYDKKVALNYRWLSERAIGTLSENASALYGEACHFLYAGKFPQNSENLANALSAEISGDCSRFSVRELAEAASALIEYSLCVQNEGLTALAIRALAAVKTKLCDFSLEEKFFVADAAASCYAATKSSVAKELFETACVSLQNFLEKAALKNAEKSSDNSVQKLCTEALARYSRGILNYAVYNESEELKARAAAVVDLCLSECLTLNYAAKNDFFAPAYADSCATALIFSLCVKLYKLSGTQKYLHFARRIWYNGLQFCQRAEGCVGQDSACVEKTSRLRVYKYTDVRAGGYYAEALAVYCKNKQLFADSGEGVSRDEQGRVFMGDKLFAKEESGFFGKDLIEIPTMTAFDKSVAMQLIFNLSV